MTYRRSSAGFAIVCKSTNTTQYTKGTKSIIPNDRKYLVLMLYPPPFNRLRGHLRENRFDQIHTNRTTLEHTLLKFHI